MDRKGISFKKKPLFDESSYRLSFYKMVLEVQPLFQQLSDEIVSESQKDRGSSTESDETPSVMKKLKEHIAKKYSDQLSADINLFKRSNSKQSDNNELKKIFEAIKKLSDLSQSVDDTTELLDSDITAELKEKLLELMQEYYYLVNLPSSLDDFRSCLNIDDKALIQRLSKDPSHPTLFDTVYFENRFQKISRESTLKQILRANRKPLKNWNNFGMLSQAVESKLLDESFFSNSSDAEFEIMKSFLTDSASTIIGELCIEFEKYFEEAVREDLIKHGTFQRKLQEEVPELVDRMKLSKDEKKFSEISKFNESRMNAYMSTSSINEYEGYMEVYVTNNAQNAVQVLEKMSMESEDRLERVLQEARMKAMRNIIFTALPKFINEISPSRLRQRIFELVGQSSQLQNILKEAGLEPIKSNADHKDNVEPGSNSNEIALQINGENLKGENIKTQSNTTVPVIKGNASASNIVKKTSVSSTNGNVDLEQPSRQQPSGKPPKCRIIFLSCLVFMGCTIFIFSDWKKRGSGCMKLLERWLCRIFGKGPKNLLTNKRND